MPPSTLCSAVRSWGGWRSNPWPPSAPGAAPDRSTTGDPAFNSPWSYLGLPTVGIPLGLDPDGMPLGLQLVGKPFAESSLLAIARRCEEIILHNTADSSRND